MRSLERHRDVGAYALGVLDEAEAFRFEDHLMECPQCALQVTEFGPAARQLMLYRSSTPRLVHPLAKPGPRMLDQLLSQVATRNRAGRRRLLLALAASVVFAVSVPAVALLARDDGGPGSVSVAATDERSGVWAEVTTEDMAWGSLLELRVKDGAGPRACRLVVVGRDGSEETVTSWSVPRHDARPNTVPGGSAMHPEEIARYEVRSADGEHLVTLEPS
ncbi:MULTISPECIES: zf-HC2 domain-containing protein [Streptomyces]|uniref:Zf-HC2 domain-containing protein n=1 Tax=Streptomyces edwardsiae TaxID=3075527 RepID=A0ABU2Q6S1_9ACTN|nr:MULTISPECIES: zf-HC2 domain-containing protein [unclassified Streptomyces]MDT0399230.1 zf-HC2 domain-containing protein [Streptomyces sp. DSM 41636]MDT0401210.1 zf-HC2 domain-containing protein [Streptomyces sp. DSM 41635]